MTTRRTTVLTIALLMLSAAVPFAYVTNGRWIANSTTMRLSAASFPAASPELNAVVAAVDKWNLNPSNFRFNMLFNDTNVAKGNGQNEIWITPGLERGGDPEPWLRRLQWQAGAEFALGLGVMAVVGALGAMSPPISG